MGGRGSGRRTSYGGKPETHDAMPLDIRKLTRKGLLVPGNSLSYKWSVNDQQVAGISIRVEFNYGLMLSYRVKSTGEVVEPLVLTLIPEGTLPRVSILLAIRSQRTTAIESTFGVLPGSARGKAW